MDSDKNISGFLMIGVAIVAGLIIGVGMGWQDYLRTAYGTKENFPILQPTGSPAVDSGSTAAVPTEFPVVDVAGGPSYNFGVTKPGVSLKHSFVIQNRGTGPLELLLQDITCKCLSLDLDSKVPTVVPPGGEFPVELEFYAEKPTENYVQQARIKTNDPSPERNILKLKIEGRVVSRINVRPDVLEVTDITASTSKQFGFNIYTFKTDEVDPQAITIASVTCDDPELQERLKFSWEPLSAAEVADEYQAASGFRVTGTIPAGMPMNNYSTEMKVTTSDGSEIPCRLLVSVKAPVTVQPMRGEKPGVRFFEESRRIEFGLLKGDESADIELMFVYRTDKKGDLKVSLGEIGPENTVRAELVEVKPTANATRVRLKISVPSDCPPIQLNGPGRDNMAKVTVLSDSPEAGEISFHVSFSKSP